VDALLRKHFNYVVLGLLALVAYLQASGLAQLVSLAFIGVGEDDGQHSVGPTSLVGPSAAVRTERVSVQPLLDRNPFDSVTGPLKPQPVAPPPSVVAEPIITDPLSAPGCDGVQVLIITESPDPSWSLAAMRGSGEQSSKLYRVGDMLSGKKVAYIGFNPVEGYPSVWFENGPSLCQAMMFGSPRSSPARPQPSVPATSMTPKAPEQAAAGDVPPEIANKIKRISDAEYHVDRSVVDKILEDQAELMRSARIVPEQRDGKVVGIRLFGIRPTSLLGVLGLQNGDRLEQINGFDMASPEKALEAYARLRTASNLTVKVTRRGQPVNIDYRIK
jgi:general secretion pathway protein C